MRRLSKKDIQLVDTLIKAAGDNAVQQDEGWIEAEIEKARIAELEAREALLKHILKLRNAQDDWMKD